MLETIVEFIHDGNVLDFATYYQHFVVASQDMIIDTSVNKVNEQISSGHGDTNDLIRGMNILAEELKTK